MNGYSAAYDDAAISVRTDRAFVRVYGRDPVRMIQGLISNDVTLASATRAVYATMLSPKGKMVCALRVFRLGDELLLETDAAAAGPLLDHLKKFIPPLFARFEDVSAHWRMLGVYGPASRAWIERTLDTSLPAEMAEDAAHALMVNDTPVLAVATSHTPRNGLELIGPADAIETVAQRMRDTGAAELDDEALDILRIEAGRPRWGADMDENTIPLEAWLRERAISETKGCYTGQEVIVRILHRGHVNWLLRGVLLGDVPPPARDAALLDAGDYRKIGRITSAVRSPALGQTIALAYVRRELALPAPAHLDSATGPRVEIVALPFAGVTTPP